MPVLVLTARGAWTERVEGIDAGADDYLPKPFHMEELVARARGLVRRAAGRGAATQAVGRARHRRQPDDGDPATACRWRSRRSSTGCSPTSRCTAARVVPPTELLEHLYGDDDAREANALEALVARLRRKLGPGVVGTRRGFGYFLEAAERGRCARSSRRLAAAASARRPAARRCWRLSLALAAARPRAPLRAPRASGSPSSSSRRDLDQLAAGLERGAGRAALTMAQPPTDPRYGQPLSGRYWQVGGRRRDRWPRARSGTAPSRCRRRPRRPPARAPPARPEGEHAAGARAQRSSPPRFGPRRRAVAVAMDRAPSCARPRGGFLRDLAPYLALLAAALIAAGWVAGRRRPAAARRRSARGSRRCAPGRRGGSATTSPSRSRPLAAEVDALIEAREAEIARARAPRRRPRARAEDAAAGADRRGRPARAPRGAAEAAAGIDEIGRRRCGATSTASSPAPASPPAGRLGLRPGGGDRRGCWRCCAAPATGQRSTGGRRARRACAARIDADDLTEALGALAGERRPPRAGPGCGCAGTAGGRGRRSRSPTTAPASPEARLGELRQRGARLDVRGPGAGLGLAIAGEIAEAAGGSLDPRATSADRASQAVADSCRRLPDAPLTAGVRPASAAAMAKAGQSAADAAERKEDSTDGDDQRQRAATTSSTGTALADMIIGRGGNDEIEGRAANDRRLRRLGQRRARRRRAATTGCTAARQRRARRRMRAATGCYGGTGNDELDGGSGNDRLFGGARPRPAGGRGGQRPARGAAAAPTSSSSTGGDGRDVIEDFRDGTDRIEVRDFDFASAAAVIDRGTQDGDDVVFDLGSDTRVVVRDADLGDFDASDFLI